VKSKKTILAEKLLQSVLEVGPDDQHQHLMSQAYSRWDSKDEPQKDWRAGMSEAERFAVTMGNLNYQVENGGFRQWIGNGYYASSYGDLREYLAEYSGRYPGIGKVTELIEQLSHLFEDFKMDPDADDPISDWQDEVEEAMNDSNWEEFDSLLGGTEDFSSSHSINRLLQAAADDDEDYDEDELSDAQEDELGEAAMRAKKSTERFLRDRMGQLDSDFYKINKQFLQDVETILVKEMATPLERLGIKARTLLSKAKSTVKGMTSGVRKLAGRFTGEPKPPEST
jgi:hypothetical protein